MKKAIFSSYAMYTKCSKQEIEERMRQLTLPESNVTEAVWSGKYYFSDTMFCEDKVIFFPMSRLRGLEEGGACDMSAKIIGRISEKEEGCEIYLSLHINIFIAIFAIPVILVGMLVAIKSVIKTICFLLLLLLFGYLKKRSLMESFNYAIEKMEEILNPTGKELSSEEKQIAEAEKSIQEQYEGYVK